MPPDAMQVKATLDGSDLNMLEAQRKAQKNVDSQQSAIDSSADLQKSAELGTGIYSGIAAFIDATAGAVGMDKLIGLKGLFPDTQESRQILRIIKQTSKEAFLNSAKGATWEQKTIDKLFPDPDKLFSNPRTEAKKFIALRKTLLSELQFNNKAIATAIHPEEIKRLSKSNTLIEQTLSLIGRGIKKQGVPPQISDEVWANLKPGDKFYDEKGKLRVKP